MTRINCGIPPEKLTDWHLIAEINEIPRVMETYRYRINTDMNFNDIPKEFTLGKGHVLFFLNKLKYITIRYFTLHVEFLKREISPTVIENLRNLSYFIEGVKQEHYKDYKPTTEDIKLITNRIIDRINNSNKFPYYYGKKEFKDIAIIRIESL